jgi:hypothetical protein
VEKRDKSVNGAVGAVQSHHFKSVDKKKFYNVEISLPVCCKISEGKNDKTIILLVICYTLELV